MSREFMTASGRRESGRLLKPLLSVEQTAVLLGESRSSLYRSIERGDLPLPVFRLNGRLRIPRRAVERLMEGELPLSQAGALAKPATTDHRKSKLPFADAAGQPSTSPM